ncbi:MAG: hypothetical protein QM820_48305 [Minicystis sp.]
MRPPHGAGCLRPRLALPTLLAIAGLPACYLDDPLVFVHDDGGVQIVTDAGDAGDASDAAPPECTADGDCDDGNACTVDHCAAGSCAHDPAKAGTVCGASTDKCVSDATCDGAGTCAPGTPIPIDDGNACTTDACDPGTGNVTHTITPGCTTPLPTTGAPTARRLHSAVWTGDRMIVWGGTGSGTPAVLATGGRFDPTTGTWTPTATTGAPPPRHSHCAVWTGDRMIVWGGFGTTAFETTGGIYDPAADTWTATATAGAPSGRVGAACVWTGKELVVWGGTAGGSVTFTGGRYDPQANTWKSLPTTGVPAPRYGHSGVWTGDRVLVWGGNDLFDWHKDGAFYNPTADAWAGSTPFAGAPAAREQHTAVWTGDRMIIWGGFDGGLYRGDGAALDVAGAAWTALSTTGAPSPRTEHAAVWTGDRMIIWGGCGMDSCTELYADGGALTPGAGGGSWSTIAAAAGITARRGPTGVWTGSVMLVWGGRAKNGETNTGALIYP